MKYIAITLGPITRTIDMAEKTKGIWAASYLFSYLGKNIIRAFKDRKFLLPKITQEMFEKTFQGAGVFPDRYIFEAKDNDFETLKNHVNCVFEELAKDMTGVINREETYQKPKMGFHKVSKEDVHIFIRRFFKVYFFEKEFDDSEKTDKIKKSCEKTLSLLEMQDTVVPQTDDLDAFINRFFKNIDKSFLTKDAGIHEKFPSIVEISSNEKDDEPMHPYQRYIAIVKADGDSMGKAFENMDSSKLSEALLDFNGKSSEIIRDYNGMPIFIGGDDLLFFAPIYSKEKNNSIETKRTIFSLLQELEDTFHNCITEKTGISIPSKHPTLSFGVSVTYYKYPMFEAMKLADKLLDQAKGKDKPKEANNLKNNILFCVQKHSGQAREALLHKGNKNTLKLFNAFICEYLEEDKQMLTSVMHGLREKDFLLSIALKDENKLKNFFENNFNEIEHKKFGKFFENIKKMLLASYDEFKEGDKLERLKYSLPKTMQEKKRDGGYIPTVEKAAVETVYNSLQFIHLVNQRNDEKDKNI